MQQWGVGSESQKVAQTIGSILTGLVTGNAGQAVAGGLNPWAAQLIKQQTTDAAGNVDVAANAMAHAVWGAVSAQMSGGNAAAGAAGAFSGELATRYIAQKYWGADTPEKIAALKEDDREQLSLLGTLAAGLAGGMAGNSSAAATTGAIAGKNAVENNYLSADQGLAFDKEMQSCKASGGDCTVVIDKWKKVSDEQNATLDPKCAENPLLCQNIDKPIIKMGSEMAERPGWIGNLPSVDVMTDEQAKIYVQYWNAQALEKLDVNSPAWAKFATDISDPENQAAVASLGMVGKDLILIAKNSFTTKSLLKEMSAQGIKFTPENIVSVAKDSSGKIIFLEKGNSKAGLQHIVEEHGSQFAQIGVSEARIPNVVMKAVVDRKIVGYQGAGTGRPIYETVINGKKYNIAVTVGNNGYIVGANLRGAVK